MRRVGIVGGGQLGAMLSSALVDLGAEVAVLDPDAHAPAALRVPRHTIAPFSDVGALEKFFTESDVVTFEFENVDAVALGRVSIPTPLWPAVSVLAVTQDRAKEKRFIEGAGAPVVRWAYAATAAEVARAAAAVGYPCIAKTARGGYDGKGQVSLRSDADLAAVGEAAGGWVCEARVAIERELSCIVARGADGEEQAFPTFENQHRDHILDLTIVPARVPPPLADEARAIAMTLARQLGVIGLLTVEFFVVDGRLVVNELAPRPHNSGHVTRRATTFSQFEALARILCGVPIGTPTLLGDGAYCMGNLLGDVWLAHADRQLPLGVWRDHPEVVEVCLYGKREPREKRKMGHFIVRAESADRAAAAATAFRDALRA